MNRIATVTSLRDISAQTTALLIDSSDYEDKEPQSPPYRSRSLNSLTVMGQKCESPLLSISPSLTPMHLGTPVAAYSLATHNHLLHIVLGLRLGLLLRLQPFG